MQAPSPLWSFKPSSQSYSRTTRTRSIIKKWTLQSKSHSSLFTQSVHLDKSHWISLPSYMLNPERRCSVCICIYLWPGILCIGKYVRSYCSSDNSINWSKCRSSRWCMIKSWPIWNWRRNMTNFTLNQMNYSVTHPRGYFHQVTISSWEIYPNLLLCLRMIQWHWMTHSSVRDQNLLWLAQRIASQWNWRGLIIYLDQQIQVWFKMLNWRRHLSPQMPNLLRGLKVLRQSGERILSNPVLVTSLPYPKYQ